MAGTYTFYGSNNGDGANLGGVASAPGKNFDLQQSNPPVTNGKAASVVLANVKANSSLVVFDNNTETLSNDSWCLITTLKDVTNHTVDSFESDSDGQSVNVNYRSNGGKGLDDKVSAISVYSAWPAAQPTILLNDTERTQEPSGLVTYTEPSSTNPTAPPPRTWLYQVSDNGQITRIEL